MQSLMRGCSPIGDSICVHLMPLNSWAVTPKINENSIQPQFMSCITVCSISLKSVFRYIHHNIAPPRMKGNAMLQTLFSLLFFMFLLLFIKKVVSLHSDV